MELEQKIQELKQEAITTPKTKSKKCHSCKKKNTEVTKLQLIEEEPLLSQQEIILAYANLTSMGGVREENKDNIQFVYQTLFNEPFDWNCKSCISTQVRKWTNWMKKNKIKV